ncbi:hypothetical protein [Atopobacter sp. AH10]|uniref:hypothetical protein n=1 Tax=Atopobacter sp. AH10 TaxID=2315861 RepID=UPI001F424F55|nr:hypothetical protein [Atopobacter sp. AH10]
MANYTADVQTSLNRGAKLHIKGLKVDQEENKVKNLVNKVSQAERYAEVAQEVEQAMTSYARSVVSDTLKKNVAFHHKLGLAPKIVRKLGARTGKKRSHSQCEFCRERVGTFEYNKDTIDKDIFRRHANCHCTLTYYPGNGKRQNAWSKVWSDVDKDGKIEERKNEALNLEMAKKRGKKIYITDQAIEKVPFVEIPGYSQEENKRIQEAHKVLLRDAQQNNQSNEVMHITTEGKPVVVYGDQVSVDINKSVQARYLINSATDRSLTILHNHPGGSSFSKNDINMFFSTSSVKTLTIVTNQGRVMYLTKKSMYDIHKAIHITKDHKEKYGNIENDIERLIKNLYHAGISYKIR